MKKIVFFIFLLLGIGLIAGCEMNEENHTSTLTDGGKEASSIFPMKFQKSENKKNPYRSIECAITIPDGWTYGDISANTKSIFYIIAEEQYMGNSMLKAKIMEYDIESGETKVCIQYEGNEGFYLNELEASSEYLFWVHTENGNNKKIECLNLSTGEMSVVKEKTEYDEAILLQADENFLTWYERSGESATIQAYDIARGESFPISDLVMRDHSYIRAHIHNGITWFVSQQNGQKWIHIYDMNQKQDIEKIEIETDIAIFNGEADDQYFIYSILPKDTMDYRIFVYDYVNERLFLANEHDDAYVFSFHNIDKKIFINERNTNSIVIRDMEHMTEQTLMDEQEHLYILASKTVGDGYVVLDCLDEENPKILYLLKK